MEIDELVTAVQTLNAEDAFRARLTLENWRVVAPYLARYEIRAGDLLIKQGDSDRSMYFIAQGSMQVFIDEFVAKMAEFYPPAGEVSPYAPSPNDKAA